MAKDNKKSKKTAAAENRDHLVLHDIPYVHGCTPPCDAMFLYQSTNSMKAPH